MEVLFSTSVIDFVSLTFLCKHFMFFIYIVYICGGVVYLYYMLCTLVFVEGYTLQFVT
jgi:hypothetical protein